MSKSTEIEIDGLHLLVVPSTSVRYDEKNERKIQFEAKQKRYFFFREIDFTFDFTKFFSHYLFFLVKNQIAKS